MVEVYNDADGTYAVRLHSYPAPRASLTLGALSARLESTTDTLTHADVVSRLDTLSIAHWFHHWDVDLSAAHYVPALLSFAYQHHHDVAIHGAVLCVLLQTAPAAWSHADWVHVACLCNSRAKFLLLSTVCATSRVPGVLKGVVAERCTALDPRGRAIGSGTDVDYGRLHDAILRGDIELVDTRVMLPCGPELVVSRARGAMVRSIFVRIVVSACEMYGYSMFMWGATLWAAGEQIDANHNTLEEHGVDDETLLEVRM